MGLGILLLLATGLVWASTGVLLSYCARNRIGAVTLLGPSTLLGLLIALSILPNWRALAGGLPLSGWILVGVLVGAGLINGLGLLTLQRAMRTGHHGVVWAIGQSAMVLPFLAAVLMFGEPPTPLRVGGVGALLASLAALGYAHRDDPAQEGQQKRQHWFLLAIAALLLLGIGQALTALPSHLPQLADPANLRVPLLGLGNAVVFLVVWGREGGRPNRRTLVLAGASALVGTASTLALFRGLDLLAQAHMAAVGFPIAVGTCVVGFGIYSAVVLHETFTRWHLVGMTLGVVGVVCVASSR